MTHKPAVSVSALLATMLLVAACRPAGDESSQVGEAEPTGRREAAVAPASHGSTAAAATDDPLAGTDALALVEHAPPADPVPAGFDARAVAGTFSGSLPCADCPGIDATLALHADGRYTLEERPLGRGDVLASDGTWMPRPDGRSLLLDPNDKDREDRRFALLSNDELRPLDLDGTPVDGSLRRRD